MVNEPKRLNISSNAVGVAGQSNARFGPGTGSILRRLTNYHNIWGSVIAEPIDADANSHGVWVLWLKSNTNDADTVWSLGNVNSDNFNMQVIACGMWAASNQTPFNSEPIHLKSSRNLVANQELILSAHIFGQTAGLTRLVCMLCAGLSVK